MKFEGVRKRWERYKYAALAALVGVGLLLWPSGSGDSPATDSGVKSRSELQKELEQILGEIDGVGPVQVLLTEDTDGERQLARDTELSFRGDPAAPEDYSRRTETVLVDGTTGDEAMVTRRLFPTYRGALVVCGGGDRASVQLAVTEAVSALTGLPTDRVSVAKGRSS